jgi:hypothetical protein
MRIDTRSDQRLHIDALAANLSDKIGDDRIARNRFDLRLRIGCLSGGKQEKGSGAGAKKGAAIDHICLKLPDGVGE